MKLTTSTGTCPGTFANQGSGTKEFWTPDRDHALLEAVEGAGTVVNPVDGTAGIDWTSVMVIFEAMTGVQVRRTVLAGRRGSLIRAMEIDLALMRARINMADAEAARVLTPPPVPVTPSWPGLHLPVRVSIAPSQERMIP